MTKEEAIEVYKELVNPRIKEAFEVFAPELAESEDERIRKDIIAFLQSMNSHCEPAQDWDLRNRWLPYLEKQKTSEEAIRKAYDKGVQDTLEKQKEQNLSNIENIYYEDIFDLSRNAVGMIRDGACYINNRNRKEVLDWLENVPKIIKQLILKIKELEKQKEQNVVPSRETILGIWELGNFWKEIPEERNGLTQLQYIQKYWFEKCDYQKGQKPAENEDDITMIDSIIDSLKFYALHTRGVAEDVENKINWLKTHTKRFISDGGEKVAKAIQDNCKEIAEAEWSEEDEENFKWFDKLFRAESIVLDGKDIPHDKYLWFKSLRSRPKASDNWKPSEEQMDALNGAIANATPQTYTTLSKLYEDLTKLK